MPELRSHLSKITNYADWLTSCWKEFTATRGSHAPTFISTFAGCGGSSLGYGMAGFRELLAVEWDDNAVEALRLNFPALPIHHGDIADLTVRHCLELTGLRPGELDVFDGSPPCQGFSLAGKRALDDPRNQLFRQYVRLLKGLRPKVFVMENVGGMVKGKMKLVFAQILKELKAAGYNVSVRLLNAMYFGVPQSRERVIFIGVRSDLKILPSHPLAETVPLTIGETLPNVGEVLFHSTGQFANKRRSEHRPAMTLMASDSSHMFAVPVFNDKYAQVWDQVPIGGNAADVLGKGFNNCVKPDPDKPAPTLPKTQTGRGFATISHWAEKRALTIPEAKRLASFPDAFQFPGVYTEQWARIGNSVPPLLMRSIARHVRANILAKISHGTQKAKAS